MRSSAQQGQAMTEFLIVAIALALALFYPYVQGESVVTLLVRTVMRVLRARTFLVSVM
jgi:hypothetical protein